MHWLSEVVGPVGFYARVSGEEQARGLTIVNQTEAAEQFLSRAGIVFHTYLDDGVTGTLELGDRPAGREIMEAARAGKLKTLIVWRVDRLGRDARHSLNTAFDLRAAGVKIFSLSEPFDCDTPIGKYLFTQWANNAELERNTILERLSGGMDRWAREGAYLGGIVPYGYVVVDRGRDRKRLVVDESEVPGVPSLTYAGVVRLIYQMVGSEGRSCVEVARHLTSLGVPPAYVRDSREVRRGERTQATAGTWSPSRIRNMIINTTYKGIHTYGRRTTKVREAIERAMPPIVSEQLWEQAQEALKRNQIDAVTNTHRVYLLRGLMVCSLCGCRYVGTHYKRVGGDERAYYACGGKTQHRGVTVGMGGVRCPSKSIPAELIESQVWGLLSSYIENPAEAIERLRRDAEIANLAAKEEQSNQSLERVIEAIAGKSAEKERVLGVYRRGIISEAEFNREIRLIESETANLQAEIDRAAQVVTMATTAMNDQVTITKMLADAQLLLKHPTTNENRREVIRRFVKSIQITTLNPEAASHNRDAQVKIIWKFGPMSEQYNAEIIPDTLSDTHSVMDSSLRPT